MLERSARTTRSSTFATLVSLPSLRHRRPHFGSWKASKSLKRPSKVGGSLSLGLLHLRYPNRSQPMLRMSKQVLLMGQQSIHCPLNI